VRARPAAAWEAEVRGKGRVAGEEKDVRPELGEEEEEEEEEEDLSEPAASTTRFLRI
jgi:hypothetical protein